MNYAQIKCQNGLYNTCTCPTGVTELFYETTTTIKITVPFPAFICNITCVLVKEATLENNILTIVLYNPPPYSPATAVVIQDTQNDVCYGISITSDTAYET